MPSYKAYAERYRQAYAAGLPALNPHALDPHLLRVARALPGPAPRLLEVGCGEGFDACALAEHGFAVTAVDVSAPAVETARRINPHPNVDYQVFDAVTGDVRARFGLFDCVYAIGCFHLLDDRSERSALLTRVRAALAPSGVLYLRDGVPDSEWGDHTAAHGELPEPARRTTTNVYASPVLRAPVPIEGAALVEPLGLDDLLQQLRSGGFAPISTDVGPGGRVFPLERVTLARKGD